MSRLRLAMGTASFDTPEALRSVLEALKELGIQEIDTAEAYGSNEANLGALHAAEQGFVISTKNPGGWRPGALRELITRTDASLARLNTTRVDVLYAHGPDRSLALDDWVPHMDALHRRGAFHQFGVSNFSAAEVAALHAYCTEKGFVPPTVYQGNYNAVSRRPDAELFPLLRRLGIMFYAYSPIAGGFLTKTRAALEDGTAGGRFAPRDASVARMYRHFYLKPALLDALDRWEALAELQGVSKAELAYRWVYYHSAVKPELGDAVILGASRVEQIKSTVAGLRRGPLKDEVVRGIDEIWELVKEDAITDNFEASGGKIDY